MITILGILDIEPFNSIFNLLLILWSHQLYMVIHFLVADAPVETVVAAEEIQQGNKFRVMIIIDRILDVKGK